MKISTKGRYALRLMLDLSEHNTGEYISLKDVATRQDISMKYLEQIVGQLTKAGYLNSVRGPQGGYKLVRTPQQYTVGEILRVTEGSDSFAPVWCVDENQQEPCVRANGCPSRPVWEGLGQTMANYVDNMNLQDILDNN